MSNMSLAFLGYGPDQTRLIDWLQNSGHSVQHIHGAVSDLSGFDRIISFGYRHILRKEVIRTAQKPIVNLHISLLPFNRGAHPNFWAWVERTPHGVSLHEIDAGLDTGPIIEQRKVQFDDDRITLRDSQSRLVSEIESLFEEVFPKWIANQVTLTPQEGAGTAHKSRDLPEWVHWDMQAKEARDRYDHE